LDVLRRVGNFHDLHRQWLNKFRKLGLIEYNGGLKVNPSLLTVVLTTDHR